MPACLCAGKLPPTKYICRPPLKSALEHIIFRRSNRYISSYLTISCHVPHPVLCIPGRCIVQGGVSVRSPNAFLYEQPTPQEREEKRMDLGRRELLFD